MMVLSLYGHEQNIESHALFSVSITFKDANSGHS